MPFDSFANFKTAIADQLARSDLTAQIPDFITLFESTAAHKLKIRPQETTVTLSTVSGVAALPSDYMGFRSVHWNGSAIQELEYVHPSIFSGLFPSSPTARPQIFTITGSSLKIMPIDDTGLTFNYFAQNSAISVSLNNLFLNHPDCYFYGVLAEAYAYIKDPEQAAFWSAKLEQEWDEIRMLNFREQGNMTIRIYGLTP